MFSTSSFLSCFSSCADFWGLAVGEETLPSLQVLGWCDTSSQTFLATKELGSYRIEHLPWNSTEITRWCLPRLNGNLAYRCGYKEGNHESHDGNSKRDSFRPAIEHPC